MRITNGAELIALERTNQDLKGYTADHDREHVDGSLLEVAQEILLNLESVAAGQQLGYGDDAPWPLALVDHISRKWTGNRVHILTIAGAMIAAEIDRLQELEARKGKKKGK